jgi:hypothetical protein
MRLGGWLYEATDENISKSTLKAKSRQEIKLMAFASLIDEPSPVLYDKIL